METLNIVKEIRPGCMGMPQNSERFIRHEWSEWADKLTNSGDSQLESIGVSCLNSHAASQNERSCELLAIQRLCL
jgi:hypothetical protein